MKTYWHITPLKNIAKIMEQGLVIPKRRKPTFTNQMGGDLRRGKPKGVYVWEHASDACQFAFSTGGWNSDEWMLLEIRSNSEFTHDQFCDCQSMGRSLILHDAVAAENVVSTYHLTRKGYDKFEHDGIEHFWHAALDLKYFDKSKKRGWWHRLSRTA